VGLICVYVAAVVTIVSSLVWMLGSKAYERMSVRRWDEGIDDESGR